MIGRYPISRICQRVLVLMGGDGLRNAEIRSSIAHTEKSSSTSRHPRLLKVAKEYEMPQNQSLGSIYRQARWGQLCVVEEG